MMIATAVDLLHEVEARGCAVRLKGDCLAIAPADRLDRVLVKRLRRAKPELLQIVRDQSPLHRVLGGVEPVVSALFEDPLGRTLGEFAMSGRRVAVWCPALRAEVILVADGLQAVGHDHRPHYFVSELRSLLGLTPEDLRGYHTVKAVFPRWRVLN